MEDEVGEEWKHVLHVEGDKKCNKILVGISEDKKPYKRE